MICNLYILRRKVNGQKVPIFAYDVWTFSPVTGDAANITAKISIDGASMVATTTTNPTELSSTDAPGVYLYDLNSAETDGEFILLYAKSSTTNVVIEPIAIRTLASPYAWVRTA